MILFTFGNDYNTAIKTEAFTSIREQFTCSDVIPTCPIDVHDTYYFKEMTHIAGSLK